MGRCDRSDVLEDGPPLRKRQKSTPTSHIPLFPGIIHIQILPSHLNNLHYEKHKQTQTRMALSAPLVIRRGSFWRNVRPAMAVVWASRIWQTSFFSSKSHSPMCPIELPDAIIGCPSAWQGQSKCNLIGKVQYTLCEAYATTLPVLKDKAVTGPQSCWNFISVSSNLILWMMIWPDAKPTPTTSTAVV